MLRRTAIQWAVSAPAPSRPKGVWPLTRYYCNMGWEACRHIYHGFRLFFKNTKVAYGLRKQLQSGVALTRRERLLLEQTTVDLLRLVPFSFFIIVPLGEFLLPVALKMFPELIPSTFETASQGKKKAFTKVMATHKARTKLEEFSTREIVAASPDYGDVLRKVAHGEAIKKKHIRRIAPMFNTGAPLAWDNIPPATMKALAQVLGIWKVYWELIPKSMRRTMVRSAVRQKIDQIKADDQLIRKEGLEMLTRDELEQANWARGMRWVDDDEALVAQLADWIELSGDEDIPDHVLQFIKPTHHSLAQSMKSLPPEEASNLLGIMNLPAGVRENYQSLCAKVRDHGDELDEPKESADDLASKVANVEKRGTTVSSEIAGASQAISEYMTKEANEDFNAVYDAILQEEGVVNVKTVTEYLAQKAHISSHVTSCCLDGMDLSEGGSEISKESFVAVMKRILLEGKNKKD